MNVLHTVYKGLHGQNVLQSVVIDWLILLCIRLLRSGHMHCYLGVGHILVIALKWLHHRFILQCWSVYKYYYLYMGSNIIIVKFKEWCNINMQAKHCKAYMYKCGCLPSVSSTWGMRGGLQMEQTPVPVQVAVQWRHSPPSGPHGSTPQRRPSSSRQSPQGSSPPHALLHLLFKPDYKRCSALH